MKMQKVIDKKNRSLSLFWAALYWGILITIIHLVWIISSKVAGVNNVYEGKFIDNILFPFEPIYMAKFIFAFISGIFICVYWRYLSNYLDYSERFTVFKNSFYRTFLSPFFESFLLVAFSFFCGAMFFRWGIGGILLSGGILSFIVMVFFISIKSIIHKGFFKGLLKEFKTKVRLHFN